MVKITTKTAASKARKPRPDFPLFPHATGRWAKKVRGRLVYFGKVDGDPKGEAALEIGIGELCLRQVHRGPEAAVDAHLHQLHQRRDVVRRQGDEVVQVLRGGRELVLGDGGVGGHVHALEPRLGVGLAELQAESHHLVAPVGFRREESCRRVTALLATPGLQRIEAQLPHYERAELESWESVSATSIRARARSISARPT